VVDASLALVAVEDHGVGVRCVSLPRWAATVDRQQPRAETARMSSNQQAGEGVKILWAVFISQAGLALVTFLFARPSHYVKDGVPVPPMTPGAEPVGPFGVPALAAQETVEAIYFTVAGIGLAVCLFWYLRTL
jgi:hypothetical protein